MVGENKNTLYNQDVAEIFIALVMNRGFAVCTLGEADIKQYARIAIELSANKPQVY